MSSSLGGGGPTGCSIFYPTSATVGRIEAAGGGPTHPYQPRAHERRGLVLGGRNVVEQGRVADDGGERVAVDVGAPLPAGRVRVPGADVLGLQALELLLRAEFVGLGF